MEGKRFGRLLVVESVLGGWLCQCDCGQTSVRTGSALRLGQSVSCGCYHRERQHEVNRTHGLTGTPVYRVWMNMRERCRNPNNTQWGDYGGRGISVCPQWESSFEQFLADMGEPAPGLTIDRINNDGPYSPENCRWATPTEQARNKRTSRMLTAGGVTQSLADWCDQLGLKYWTIHSRLRRGKSDQEALGL